MKGINNYFGSQWSFARFKMPDSDNENIEPEIEKMHMQLIKLIDQVRMLDQDMIRLQQKVDVILEMRENEKKRKDERKT